MSVLVLVWVLVVREQLVLATVQTLLLVVVVLVELVLLVRLGCELLGRRALQRRLGRVPVVARQLGRLLASARTAAAAAAVVELQCRCRRGSRGRRRVVDVVGGRRLERGRVGRVQ